MAGFLDVVLRGCLLACVAVAAGGVAWLCLVLRVEPGTKPDRAAAASLRLIGAAAVGAAVAQAGVALLVLGDIAGEAGAVAAYAETTFARVAAARVVLAALLALLATRLARHPAGSAPWWGLGAVAVGLVIASVALGHTAARLDHRPLLAVVTAVHQLAVAAWLGGLAHLALFAARARVDVDPRAGPVARRFSRLALAAMAAIVGTGAALTALYVDEPAALAGTAYGIMILSKVALLLPALGLAALNLRAVRRAAGAADLRLGRLVEVELGLGLTIVFAAASLTSLPPAVDVAAADRATPAEVAARFAPAVPRLASPPIGALLETAEPLMGPPGVRTDVERAWSEYNHHVAGLFVLAMGLLALAEGAGVRRARHWPLVLLGLAAFMFLRNDPRAWPLGPAGFWESMALPDVLQHRAFVVVVVALAVFEWAVRTGRLQPRPWSYVFPLLCAAAGGLLLTHSHAMFDLRAEFLTEVTHTPLALFGAFAGWARWIEVRLPGAGAAPGWTWRGCLAAVGVLLLLYTES